MKYQKNEIHITLSNWGKKTNKRLERFLKIHESTGNSFYTQTITDLIEYWEKNKLPDTITTTILKCLTCNAENIETPHPCPKSVDGSYQVTMLIEIEDENCIHELDRCHDCDCGCSFPDTFHIW